MAEYAADNITWYLLTDEAHKDDLAGIRQWPDLKAGTDGHEFWVKGFDYAQVHSVELKSIPFATVFYEQQGKLFLQNSRLPHRNMPSVLWTPIDRALPVRLPSFNHNYFGTDSRVQVSLVPSDKETTATAVIVTIEALEQYIITAPAVRLQPINWALLDQTHALLAGWPLLPVQGTAFWQRKDILLPAGFDFDLHILADVVNETLNPGFHNWLVWQADNTYFPVSKKDMQPLSLESFRSSTARMVAPNF